MGTVGCGDTQFTPPVYDEATGGWLHDFQIYFLHSPDPGAFSDQGAYYGGPLSLELKVRR